MYTQQPILTEKNRRGNFGNFIKKEKVKYRLVISIQTLCWDTKWESLSWTAQGAQRQSCGKATKEFPERFLRAQWPP